MTILTGTGVERLDVGDQPMERNQHAWAIHKNSSSAAGSGLLRSRQGTGR